MALRGLSQVESGDKIWTIGALVTAREIERNAEIAKVFPGLHDGKEARMSVAAAKVEGGRMSQPRVALGSISPVPHQVEVASQLLDGKMLDDDTVAHAADMLLAGATPLEHNAYRLPLACAGIRRTLLKLKSRYQ